MKTMFPSQEKNTKKKFQKPNILRKRSKKPVKAITPNESFESPERKSQVNNKHLIGVDENETNLDTVETLYSITQSGVKQDAETEIEHLNFDITKTNVGPIEDSKLALEKNEILVEDNTQMLTEETNISAENNSNNALVNIESFFNETAGEKYMLFDFGFEAGKQTETLVVIDDKSQGNEVYIDQNPEMTSSMVPLSAVSNLPQEAIEEESNISIFSNMYTSLAPTVKYKCDVPNCTKEFRSEQKYKKHKNSHERDGSIRPPRQVTVECPVKKVEADGTEISCGKLFLVRELLLKHLAEEHTLDDAVNSCEECGRRFFWASGLRAHVRAHCRRAEGEAAARAGGAAGPGGAVGAGGAAGPGGEAGAGGAAGAGGLVCGWPGCGRVFRQPCRLREHARSHTGDRPYPCQYPNCGWSFRSASKLMRHARRHTGERRHGCAACGRAFLRREHLRDHHARHHAPHARRRPACTHPGCEQTFNNMSTLYLHLKKVHKKQEAVAPATATTETLITVPDNMFMVSLAPEQVETIASSPAPPDDGTIECVSLEAACSDGEAEAEAEAEAEDEYEDEHNNGDASESHSARTHCTWPLERAPLMSVDSPGDNLLKDDDCQVEQSEGSESNTFTVRSDLFLHGNVMINEDSEHMGVAEAAADSLGAELGLLDAHPTIDLMQEELMYADTAADESSFRIFLLSGEELT